MGDIVVDRIIFKCLSRTRVENIFFCLNSGDRLCGLVVRVLGYRFGGPGSIPGTTRFSDQKKKKENK
jgi:hypothetical protein